MRRTNSAPKRAASGARGRSSTSAMRFSPTCESASMVSAGRRSAARGRGERSLFIPRGNDPHPAHFVRRPSPFQGEGKKNRATPHAQPTVSATATRACRPWRVQPPHQIVRQRRLAAEQMRAARNVEGQPVGRIEPDQRRVAVAPLRDRFEQREVGTLVRVRHVKLRIHRARVGERHAHAQAERRRGVVHGGEPQRALDGCGDDQRVRRKALRDPVGRQAPQPHRQIAPRRCAHDGSR